jgi:hypothetical protein
MKSMKNANRQIQIRSSWLNDFAPVKLMVASLAVLAATVIHSLAQSASYDANVKLTLHLDGPNLAIHWPSQSVGNGGTAVFPWFEVQRSTDLNQWQPLGERQRGSAALPDLSLSLALGTDQPGAFYRLLEVQQPAVANLGSGGAEVFGYGDAFTQALQRIGQISPDEFAAMFPTTASYLPAITWDPTTAQYWDLFSADPAVVNGDKQPGDRGYRCVDTRLNAPELAIFQQNGFVVSGPPGGASFAEVFYNLFYSDLPIFVSTDALLEAWHRTYDAMLEETEETYLFNSVGTMLDGMAAQVAAADAVVGNGPLHESLRDADWFLAVARSLLAGTNQPPVPSVLGQDARVAATLADIYAEQLMEVDDFMGFCRVVDFSQFQIRGHYTHSDRLGRYFQCTMWLGFIDVPVAGGPFQRCPLDPPRMASPRELGVAVVFWYLLNQSAQFQTWANMEKITSAFVGWTDSMNFGQLNGLLAGAGIRTLADVPDVATLSQLQTNIVNGALGLQNIRSGWFGSPLGGAARYALPQTFTVFGQKFVPDSWAFSETVYDSILWVENGQTNKVQRRVPGALDAAFAVLGNDQVVPELVAQMKGTFPDTNRPHAMQWRDGQPYQHNLAAARAVMDQQTPDAWDSNMYMSWLACLRELSAPTTDAQYPEAMRTRAWAMKTLNTQLASWTHLRHDTILYAKQSYTTGGGGCLYPTGYVEPRVEFWNRLGAMAARTAELISGLPYQGSYTYVGVPPPLVDPVTGEEIPTGDSGTNTVTLATIRNRQVAHLQRFAGIAARLADLAAKELAQESFTPEDEQFVGAEVVEFHPGGGLCGWRPPTCSGWYPKLFYRTIYWDPSSFDFAYGSLANDAIVADVHTDVPDLDVGDPGSVLHEGIGRVNLLLIAVDNGADRFICAGPVLSHYEIEVIGPPRRLTDDEWGGGVTRAGGGGILDGIFPSDVDPSQVEGLAPPIWTTGYLVP